MGVGDHEVRRRRLVERRARREDEVGERRDLEALLAQDDGETGERGSEGSPREREPPAVQEQSAGDGDERECRRPEQRGQVAEAGLLEHRGREGEEDERDPEQRQSARGLAADRVGGRDREHDRSRDRCDGFVRDGRPRHEPLADVAGEEQRGREQEERKLEPEPDELRSVVRDDLQRCQAEPREGDEARGGGTATARDEDGGEASERVQAGHRNLAAVERCDDPAVGPRRLEELEHEQ